MTSIPEADIDYDAVNKANEGELIYSKTSFFSKPKWVIKIKGQTYIFEDYDVALQFSGSVKEKK